MADLESEARKSGARKLYLYSSLNARGFYDRQGFGYVRENWHEGTQTVVMYKRFG